MSDLGDLLGLCCDCVECLCSGCNCGDIAKDTVSGVQCCVTETRNCCECIATESVKGCRCCVKHTMRIASQAAEAIEGLFHTGVDLAKDAAGATATTVDELRLQPDIAELPGEIDLKPEFSLIPDLPGPHLPDISPPHLNLPGIRPLDPAVTLPPPRAHSEDSIDFEFPSRSGSEHNRGENDVGRERKRGKNDVDREHKRGENDVTVVDATDEAAGGEEHAASRREQWWIIPAKIKIWEERAKKTQRRREAVEKKRQKRERLKRLMEESAHFDGTEARDRHIIETDEDTGWAVLHVHLSGWLNEDVRLQRQREEELAQIKREQEDRLKQEEVRREKDKAKVVGQVMSTEPFADEPQGVTVSELDGITVHLPSLPAPQKVKIPEGEKKQLFADTPIYRIDVPKSASSFHQWWFLNDSDLWELHVEYTFKNGDTKPLGTAKAKKIGGATVISDTIYPHCCNPFLECTALGDGSTVYRASNLSDEWKERCAILRIAKVDAEINAVRRVVAKDDDDETRLKKCLENGVWFVDLSFPPKAVSLVPEGKGKQFVAVSWERPRLFLPKDVSPSLVKNIIEPNDVDQGRLGDCWFVNALAAVAEFPDRIERMFEHPNGSNLPAAMKRLSDERFIGAYRVWINKHGWWENVIVDEYLPVDEYVKPLFASNEQEPGELWASVVEKAYAKLHKCYAALVGGPPSMALTDITGFPSQIFSLDFKGNVGKKSACFKSICSWDRDQYVMSVSTKGTDQTNYASGKSSKEVSDKYEKVGLVPGHAYTLLDAVHMPEKHLHLCRIRNPWGNAKEWTGKWSDNDASWADNPDVVEACHFEGAAEDGTFWMEFDDVCPAGRAPVGEYGPWSVCCVCVSVMSFVCS